MQFADVLVRPRGLNLAEQALERFIVGRLDSSAGWFDPRPKPLRPERKLGWAPGPSAGAPA